jgi:hypothetical protein
MENIKKKNKSSGRHPFQEGNVILTEECNFETLKL